MSDQPRALPDQPSLRYLKVEAKRRLSAGEFATLHEAQLTIAREHGLPSWTALKEYISAGPSQASPVLSQARWVISRFAEAGTPGWTVPGGGELGEHFDAQFLRRLPPEPRRRRPWGRGVADHPAGHRAAQRRPGQPALPDRAGQCPPGPPIA